MRESIHHLVRQRISAIVADLFGVDDAEVVIEVPPQLEFGDLAVPISFELARRLRLATGEKQNPRKLAESIAARLEGLDGVSKIEVAGAGYINVFFDRAKYLIRLTRPLEGPNPTGQKVIVEHTSVNPNKAAHIGHLRNAVLGDTLVRLLQQTGEKVEVHNYIDNTGVQVADVVVGVMYLEKKTVKDLDQIASKFDHYCWDLYARVTSWYQEEPATGGLRRRVLSEIEHGDNPTAELAEYVSMRVLNCQLDTIERLGIRYDLLPRESEILQLKFWEHAFEMLKSAGLVYYETEAKNRGCWVMKPLGAAEPKVQAEPDDDEVHDEAKILVRSDGTVVYTGKDIAYHLWKLGRLGVDFNYKPFRVYSDGHVTWITTAGPAGHTRLTRPIFGHGSAYLSVIGSEQSYLQMFVKQAVTALIQDQRAERSAHVGYEKVALTPAACVELGIELAAEEMNRQQIGMSGRRGLGVKADDLINKLEEKATAEVGQRHPELSTDECSRVGHQIAVAALRYFLLKYSRTTRLAFDFTEALSFEGETGPYLQYAVVRANSIFRKLEEAEIRRQGLDQVEAPVLNKLLSGEQGDDMWGLISLAGRLEEMVRQACVNYEPSIVAKYSFQLAQRFNNFYHTYHILSESDPVQRELYLAIADIVKTRLVRTLGLLGIETPERM
jgi:arginyl-tRNA synthetase